MEATRRSRIRALAVLVVVGGVAGLVVGIATPTTYTATATVLVATGTTTRADIGESTPFPQQVRSAWASIATAPIVLDPVRARLHLPLSRADLAKRVTVEEPADQALIRISVSDPSASGAAAIANAVQDRLVALAPRLSPQGSGPAEPIVSVQRAVPPESPTRSVALLGLAGALTGAAVWGIVMIVLLIRRVPRPPRGTAAPSML